MERPSRAAFRIPRSSHLQEKFARLKYNIIPKNPLSLFTVLIFDQQMENHILYI